jgi:hypothetical protein
MFLLVFWWERTEFLTKLQNVQITWLDRRICRLLLLLVKQLCYLCNVQSTLNKMGLSRRGCEVIVDGSALRAAQGETSPTTPDTWGTGLVNIVMNSDGPCGHPRARAGDGRGRAAPLPRYHYSSSSSLFHLALVDE